MKKVNTMGWIFGLFLGCIGFNTSTWGTYQIVDLGILEGRASVALSINNQGQVVG